MDVITDVALTTIIFYNEIRVFNAYIKLFVVFANNIKSTDIGEFE